MGDWGGRRFTDMFTKVKADREWKAAQRNRVRAGHPSVTTWLDG